MTRDAVRILDVAIERKDWEAAAVCLLLGVSRAARKLPPDAIDALLAELSSELEPEPRHRRRSRRERR